MLLFLPAGRLDWWMAWLLASVYLGGIFLTALLAAVRDPQLARERAQVPETAKAWDRRIINFHNLLTYLIMLPLAGLDMRFGWSPPLPMRFQLLALVAFALGVALVDWVLVSNPFFSAVVRLQEDRGHAVAASGPYRCMRHPGYLGMLAMFLSAPLALGSLWALLPASVSACLVIYRTALEDRMLLEELEGYQEYARRVCYRLLPGLW